MKESFYSASGYYRPERFPIVRGLAREVAFVTVLPVLSVFCTIVWPRNTYRNIKGSIKDACQTFFRAKDNFCKEFSTQRYLARQMVPAAIYGLEAALNTVFKDTAEDYELMALRIRESYGPTRDRTATFST